MNKSGKENFCTNELGKEVGLLEYESCVPAHSNTYIGPSLEVHLQAIVSDGIFPAIPIHGSVAQIIS